MKKRLQIVGLIAVPLISPFLVISSAFAHPGKPTQATLAASGHPLNRIFFSPFHQIMAPSASGEIRIITEQYTPPNNGGPGTSTASGTR